MTNPEQHALDDIDALIATELDEDGVPLDDYSKDRYSKCEKCQGHWHGLPSQTCGGAWSDEPAKLSPPDLRDFDGSTGTVLDGIITTFTTDAAGQQYRIEFPVRDGIFHRGEMNVIPVMSGPVPEFCIEEDPDIVSYVMTQDYTYLMVDYRVAENPGVAPSSDGV